MDSRSPDRKNRIRVLSYAGYRSEESPRTLVIGEKSVSVQSILERWVEEGITGRDRKMFFRVIGEDGLLYLISYDEDSGGWYLEKIATA